MRRRAARNAIHWRAAKRWMEHYIKSHCVYMRRPQMMHILTHSVLARKLRHARALFVFCVAAERLHAPDTLCTQIQSARTLGAVSEIDYWNPFKMSANWKALLIHQSENLSCELLFGFQKARMQWAKNAFLISICSGYHQNLDKYCSINLQRVNSRWIVYFWVKIENNERRLHGLFLIDCPRNAIHAGTIKIWCRQSRGFGWQVHALLYNYSYKIILEF